MAQSPLKKRFANLTMQTTLTKPRRVYGHALYLSAIRRPNDSVIIGSNTPGDHALWTYKGILDEMICNRYF